MRLHVTVQLRGELIEDVVVPVRDGMRLGSHPEAAVAFPGDDVLVQLREERVWVRGRSLGDGDCLAMRLDDVHVRIEPVTEVLLSRGPVWRGDIRLAVALAAVVLLTMSGQTLRQVLVAKADVSEGVVNRVEALLLPERVELPEAQPEPERWPVEHHVEAPAVRYVEQTALP